MSDEPYDLDYLWIGAVILFGYALLAAACRIMSTC
jgi:hypothetical protein